MVKVCKYRITSYNVCYTKLLRNNPLVVAFGEDIGKLGGVNQTFEGLQAKHGELRIRDT